MKVTSNVLLEGFWQHHKYYNTIKPQLLEEFTLKEEYKVGLPALISEIEKNDHSVSLHIRRGDYVSDPNNLDWFGVMPPDYYYQAVDYIKKRISNPVYYIFSDDLDWVKENIRIDGQVVYVDIEGGKKDYLELYAMSKCRHQVIANSSFSWWGAYLNNRPEKIVIAPARWVAMEDLNRKVSIQLPSWIKM
jgi:hypothetical protein